MNRLVAASLRSAAEAAVTHGIGFLDSVVGADGAWRCDWSGPTQPPEDRIPPFVAAFGVLALDAAADERAAALISRSRRFILSRIEAPGIWRWAPHDFEVDSTSICSLAAGPQRHPWLLLGRNVRVILSRRDDSGRFPTWMGSCGPFGEPNDIDPVVNANVVTYLGDRDETRASQRWIERLVVADRVAGSSIWYRPMDLYYSVSRAIHAVPPTFAGLGSVLARRVAGRSPATAFRAAQALGSLDRLDDPAHHAFMVPCGEQLIASQLPNGGWTATEFLRSVTGGAGRRTGDASESVGAGDGTGGGRARQPGDGGARFATRRRTAKQRSTQPS